MEFLNIDILAFNYINHQLQTLLFDKVMPFITYVSSGAAVWLIFAIMIYFFVPQTGRITAVLMLTALFLSNLLTNELLKNLFDRPRPFLTLPEVRLLVEKPLSFSFPSGHSAISFASAVIIAKKIKSLAIFVMFIAVAIAFSRVYVGVHYPFDVIAGGILGWLCALLVLYFDNKLNVFSHNQKRNYKC